VSNPPRPPQQRAKRVSAETDSGSVFRRFFLTQRTALDETRILQRLAPNLRQEVCALRFGAGHRATSRSALPLLS
jgi:hypothetical protein